MKKLLLLLLLIPCLAFAGDITPRDIDQRDGAVGFGSATTITTDDNPCFTVKQADGTAFITADCSVPDLTIGADDATTQLILPISNDAVTPTLAFGDGNTGFYESSDNSLNVAIAGTNRWYFSGSTFAGQPTNAPVLDKDAASATVPNIMPNRQDLDTGIGTAAADQLSLIAGGVEGIRITEPGVNDSTPTTNVKGDLVVTGSGLQTLDSVLTVDTFVDDTCTPGGAVATTGLSDDGTGTLVQGSYTACPTTGASALGDNNLIVSIEVSAGLVITSITPTTAGAGYVIGETFDITTTACNSSAGGNDDATGDVDTLVCDGTYTGVATTKTAGNGDDNLIVTVTIADDAITVVTVTTAGAGYAIDDTITLTGLVAAGCTECDDDGTVDIATLDDTIVADSCGSMKDITALAAITTDTTDTFTTPASANDGCCMDLNNVGAATITLDNNGNFISAAAGNVAMTQLDTLRVCSNGTAWYQITPLHSNN